MRMAEERATKALAANIETLWRSVLARHAPRIDTGDDAGAS